MSLENQIKILETEFRKIYNPTTAMGNRELIAIVHRIEKLVDQQQKAENCPRCDSDGYIQERCGECDGTGVVSVPCDH